MAAVGQHEVPSGAEQRVEPVSAGRRASEQAKPCGEMRPTARDLLHDGSARNVRNGWKADTSLVSAGGTKWLKQCRPERRKCTLRGSASPAVSRQVIRLQHIGMGAFRVVGNQLEAIAN